MEMEPPPLDALLESEKGGAAPLATSVVAHTDRAGELEAYGFPATNALRHNGVPRRCPTLSLSLRAFAPAFTLARPSSLDLACTLQDGT